MKIIHTLKTDQPYAGLYRSAVDLMLAEQRLGHDVRIVDPSRPAGVRTIPIPNGADWVQEADVIVNHVGLGQFSDYVSCPIIHCLHGRPRSSFLLEKTGQIPVYRFMHSAVQRPDFRYFVCFWAEFLPYWRMLIPEDRLRFAPPPIDLNHWCPGSSSYDFGGRAGKINVIVTDPWRIDTDPYWAICGFWHFADTHPGARLHLYGTETRGLESLLGCLEEQGSLGEIKEWEPTLLPVYRAADAVLSFHKIATRSIRESLACDIPVVVEDGSSLPVRSAPKDDPVVIAAALEAALETPTETRGSGYHRAIAEREFSSIKTADFFNELFQELTDDEELGNDNTGEEGEDCVGPEVHFDHGEGPRSTGEGSHQEAEGTVGAT